MNYFMPKSKVVTIKKLWLEFKKSIDYGVDVGFDNPAGMLNMICTKQKDYPGRIMKFLFYQPPGVYLECVLEMDWPSTLNAPLT